MTEVIIPGRLFGTVAAPPSKSHLQRAIAIAALAEGESHIHGYAPSSDVDAAIRAVQALGAQAQIIGSTVVVTGPGNWSSPTAVHCGESGLAARMFSCLAALSSAEITVTGEGTLLGRPFAMVQDALAQLGKNVGLNHGRLPLVMSGELRSAEISIDGSESSQLLSGLLIALPVVSGRSVIHVRNLNSRPYVQMTIDMLAQFGIQVQHEHFERFIIEGNQQPRAVELTTEGDWSGAAFLLAGGAIAGEVTVSGLDVHSSQADRGILEVLKAAGAGMEVQQDSITVRSAPLKAFRFDATHCPDLFPPLAALAVCCEGTSTILGVERLRHKESDRAATILHVLQQFGIKARLEEHVMLIEGGKATGASVSSHHDHRIAMMAALIGKMARGDTEIESAEAVYKSYPDFFLDMASLASDSR